MSKTKNIMIRVPIAHMDDIGPEVGSLHPLRERGREGREIEVLVAAQGARWSNAPGQYGRWIRLVVPADWAGTAGVEEYKTADDLLAEATSAENTATETLVGAYPRCGYRSGYGKDPRYPAEVSIEWNLQGAPHPYVIQLGPAVRVSGQLQAAESWFDKGGLPQTARLEYRNKSALWKETSPSADGQRAVSEFAEKIMKTPHTAQQAAEAHVAAIRRAIRKPDRNAVRKYSAAVSFEWDFGGAPSNYVIQLSPVGRISGQLTRRNDVGAAHADVLSQESSVLRRFKLETARMEYQNESTPWLELRLNDDDQLAVVEFVRELLRRE